MPVVPAARQPCPGERQLVEGAQAYEEGRYRNAESLLLEALDRGLPQPADRAQAFKLLGFIACTSGRLELCEAAFISARRADPAFALARAEFGHPVWGPIFQRVLER